MIVTAMRDSFADIGKLKAVRRGRSYFVPRADLKAFLEGEPVTVPQIETPAERRARMTAEEIETDRILRAAGIKK